MEKPGSHLLTQVIKVSIPSIGTNGRHVLCDWQSHNITSVAFLPKLHKLNYITKKHQTIPNWGTHCKILDSTHQKVSRLWKTKTKELLRLKETRDVKNKCDVWSWIGSYTKKETLMGQWKLPSVCRLVTLYQCRCPGFDQVRCLWVTVTVGEQMKGMLALSIAFATFL